MPVTARGVRVFCLSSAMHAVSRGAGCSPAGCCPPNFDIGACCCALRCVPRHMVQAREAGAPCLEQSSRAWTQCAIHVECCRTGFFCSPSESVSELTAPLRCSGEWVDTPGGTGHPKWVRWR